MEKRVGIIKRCISMLLIFLLSINSFAAIVSDNDGSAFITKSEFDALKSSFQSQIDSYNNSIDSKIDGAIASYLAGIKLASEWSVFPGFENIEFDNHLESTNEDGANLKFSYERLSNIYGYEKQDELHEIIVWGTDSHGQYAYRGAAQYISDLSTAFIGGALKPNPSATNGFNVYIDPKDDTDMTDMVKGTGRNTYLTDDDMAVRVCLLSYIVNDLDHLGTLTAAQVKNMITPLKDWYKASFHTNMNNHFGWSYLNSIGLTTATTTNSYNNVNWDLFSDDENVVLRSQAHHHFYDLWANTLDLASEMKNNIQQISRPIWNSGNEHANILMGAMTAPVTWGEIKNTIYGWEDLYVNQNKIPGLAKYATCSEAVKKSFVYTSLGKAYAIRNINSADEPYYFDGFYDEYGIQTIADSQFSHAAVNLSIDDDNFDDTYAVDNEIMINNDFLQHESATAKQDKNSNLTSNFWWTNNNYAFKNKRNKVYDYYQIGHLSSAPNVVCCDYDLNIDPARTEYINVSSSDLTMNRSGQYISDGNTIYKGDYILSNGKVDVPYYRPYIKTMSPWQIVNQYFSNLVGYPVYFGGGVPVAKIEGEKLNNKLIIKFKVINSSGENVPNAQVQYAVSDKQFKEGNVDTAAGGHQIASGTTTAGQTVTIPNFNIDGTCVLWLNAYAVNEGCIVKIEELLVQ